MVNIIQQSSTTWFHPFEDHHIVAINKCLLAARVVVIQNMETTVRLGVGQWKNGKVA